MAMNTGKTLSSVPDMIMPGVWACAQMANAEGIPISDAHVDVDYARYEVNLYVKHRLVSGSDYDSDRWKDQVGPRVAAAMRLFHRMPAAKALCVDRRRLMARGEKARKETNRPVRAD